MYEAVIFFNEGHHRCEAEFVVDALCQADLLVQEENDAIQIPTAKSDEQLDEAYTIVPSGSRSNGYAVKMGSLTPQVLYIVYNTVGSPVGTLRLMK